MNLVPLAVEVTRPTAHEAKLRRLPPRLEQTANRKVESRPALACLLPTSHSQELLYGGGKPNDILLGAAVLIHLVAAQEGRDR
jgi:hypothetical protein